MECDEIRTKLRCFHLKKKSFIHQIQPATVYPSIFTTKSILIHYIYTIHITSAALIANTMMFRVSVCPRTRKPLHDTYHNREKKSTAVPCGHYFFRLQTKHTHTHTFSCAMCVALFDVAIYLAQRKADPTGRLTRFSRRRKCFISKPRAGWFLRTEYYICIADVYVSSVCI